MSPIASTFLRGLSVIVPVGLTIWIIVWLAISIETLLRRVFVFVLPEEYYLPGLGFALGVAIIYATGVLVQVFIVKQIWEALQRLLERIPLVKTVYSAISDFFGFFSQQPDSGSMVVKVELVSGASLIGFVTDDAVDLGASAAGAGHRVAVYFPMSYQMGGYTLLVDADRVEPFDIPVEEAMRYVLTAGIQGRGAGQ